MPCPLVVAQGFGVPFAKSDCPLTVAPGFGDPFQVVEVIEVTWWRASQWGRARIARDKQTDTQTNSSPKWTFCFYGARTSKVSPSKAGDSWPSVNSDCPLVVAPCFGDPFAKSDCPLLVAPGFGDPFVKSANCQLPCKVSQLDLISKALLRNRSQIPCRLKHRHQHNKVTGMRYTLGRLLLDINPSKLNQQQLNRQIFTGNILDHHQQYTIIFKLHHLNRIWRKFNVLLNDLVQWLHREQRKRLIPLKMLRLWTSEDGERVR